MQSFYAGLALGFAIILFWMEGEERKNAAKSTAKSQSMFSSLTPKNPGLSIVPSGCGTTPGSMDNMSPANAAITAPGMYPASSSGVM